jgi:N-methylhydantoinase A/oxoprolinase/acetone carboxylase beta subunit
MYRIGVDVGGTFTDLVAVDDCGKATLAKVTSTPEDPSIGVIDGLGLLAETLGTALAALLAETERVVHGTTVATNALLEHKGSRVGLLTTEGHRDCRRPNSSSRVNCASACASACAPTARSRHRSTPCRSIAPSMR